MRSCQKIGDFAIGAFSLLLESTAASLEKLRGRLIQGRDRVRQSQQNLTTTVKIEDQQIHKDMKPAAFSRQSIVQQLPSRLSGSTDNEYILLHSPIKHTEDMKHLRQLEQQRQLLKQQIQAVDEEISRMKNDKKGNKYYKDAAISNDVEACQEAQRLIAKLTRNKKAHERRRQQLERRKQELIQREEETRKQEIEQAKQRILSERRASIQRRLELEVQRREDMKTLDSLSNSLIRDIKKSERVKRILTESTVGVPNTDLKRLQKNSVDLRTEISQHEKRYLIQKQSAKPTERSFNGVEPLQLYRPKYHRGKFSRLVEEEERQREEEEILKEEMRYVQLEKRKKYGELVTTLFQEHNKSLTSQKKPITSESASKGSRTKTIAGDKLSEPQLGDRPHKHIPTQLPTGLPRNKQILTSQEREERDRELRKHTKEKLRELEKLKQSLKQSNPEPPPSTRKYKNYLEVLPRIEHNDNRTVSRILQSKKLTKEEKFVEVMHKADDLQHRARRKEERLKNPTENEEVVGLIVSSIQAKLALLNNL